MNDHFVSASSFLLEMKKEAGTPAEVAEPLEDKQDFGKSAKQHKKEEGTMGGIESYLRQAYESEKQASVKQDVRGVLDSLPNDMLVKIAEDMGVIEKTPDKLKKLAGVAAKLKSMNKEAMGAKSKAALIAAGVIGAGGAGAAAGSSHGKKKERKQWNVGQQRFAREFGVPVLMRGPKGKGMIGVPKRKDQEKKASIEKSAFIQNELAGYYTAKGSANKQLGKKSMTDVERKKHMTLGKGVLHSLGSSIGGGIGSVAGGALHKKLRMSPTGASAIGGLVGGVGTAVGLGDYMGKGIGQNVKAERGLKARKAAKSKMRKAASVLQRKKGE